MLPQSPLNDAFHKIAWFSPLAPGLRSSWLSESLLSSLANRQTPSVFCYSDERREGASHYFRAFQEERSGALDFGVHVLENRAECGFVEQSLRISPGVGIFLDVNLSNIVLRRFRQSTGAADIDSLYESAFGKQAFSLGEYQVRGWPTEIFERFFPLGTGLLEAAPLALFPGRALERSARKLSPGLRSGVLPIPLRAVAAEQISAERRLVRASLELVEGTPVVGIGGRFPPDAGALSTFEALSELRNARPKPEICLLWILDGPSSEDAARNFALRYLPASAFRIAAPETVQEARFFHSACDAMILIQADARQGFPPSFIPAAERGVPAVVSTVGFAEDVPPDAALHIRPDDSEQSVLSRAIEELARNPALREAVGSAFARYVSLHSPERSRDVLFEHVRENFAAIRAQVSAHRGELLAARRGLLSASRAGITPRLSSAAAEARRETLESLGWNIFGGHSDAI